MPSLDTPQRVSTSPRIPAAAARRTGRAATRGPVRTRPAFQATRDADGAPTPDARRLLNPETLAAIALCQGAGLVGVPSVIGAMRSGWYRRPRKSATEPPAAVPTWTALYVLQGLALRDSWKHVDTPEGSAAVRASAAQLALNAAWSPASFGQRSPAGAATVAGGLLPAVLRTVERARRVSPKAAMLRTPYVGWVAFATLVDAAIVALNRGLPGPDRSAGAPVGHRRAADRGRR